MAFYKSKTLVPGAAYVPVRSGSSRRATATYEDPVKRKLREMCMIPTVSSVTKSALQALEESVGQRLPHGLTGARRAEVLARTANNSVPESVVIECALNDLNKSYMADYSTAARAALKAAGMDSLRAARKAMERVYWTYITECSGLDATERAARGGNALCGKKPNSKKDSSAVLFFSTFGSKPLIKKPLHGAGANLAYCRLRKELASTMDGLQRFVYYMRPEDPMNRSEDTAHRLEEVLNYVTVLYALVTGFMDRMDAKILWAAGLPKGPYGPREPNDPDTLLVRYVKNSSGRAAGAPASNRLTHDAIMVLMKLCALLEQTDVRKKTCRALAIAVADIVTFISHHCQYLINIVLVGYACWLRGGLNDRSLRTAVKHQDRFNHFFGKLTPVLSSHSWAAMEVGTAMWVKVAVAAAIVRHGGPTPHYLLTTGTPSGLRRPRNTDKLGRQRPASARFFCERQGASTGALFIGTVPPSSSTRDSSPSTNFLDRAEGDGCDRIPPADREATDPGAGLRNSLVRSARFEDLPSLEGSSAFAKIERVLGTGGGGGGDDHSPIRDEGDKRQQKRRLTRGRSGGRHQHLSLGSSFSSETSAVSSGRTRSCSSASSSSGSVCALLRTLDVAASVPEYQQSERTARESLSGDDDNNISSGDSGAESETEEYWYVNQRNSMDTYACAADIDSDEEDRDSSRFPSFRDVNEYEEVAPLASSESSGGDDSTLSDRDGENQDSVYVSMEEIEACRARQMLQDDGYDVPPFAKTSAGPKSRLTVPSSAFTTPPPPPPLPASLPKQRPGFPLWSDPYDLPRRPPLARTLIMPSGGEAVVYDVPKPFPSGLGVFFVATGVAR